MGTKTPEDVEELVLSLKSQLYTKGSIAREVKKITKDKELAKKYVDEVLGNREKVMTNNPTLRYREINDSLKTSSITTGTALLVGIVLALLLGPSNGFTRVSIIFSIGAFIMTMVLLVQLGYYKGKNRTAGRINSSKDSSSDRAKREWKDLD